jgi:UDP-N-acetylmuramoylalanine--D-glutamate ligase
MAAFDLDALTLADVEAGALRGRRVTVLGFARSGIALARFFADAGADVTVYDARPATELGSAVAALDGRRVTLALGPAVDPAAAWADADLVATSPSINADYPTTEPRLRGALLALRDREGAPPVVSEADLVLRLCPAPTIGVTGPKGKTTTSALIAAVLAGDPSHPVVLGGNMGDPLIDRLPGITADSRVVIELSELQLPTLSRGTTVAAYTNVTSDHLDRHGSLEAYRRVKRRLAELVDPDGALVLNAEDPVVAAYAGLGLAPAILYRTERPMPGGVGVADDWIVAAAVQPLTGGGAYTGRVMPVGELAVPGRHNVANALAAVSVGLLFGVAPDAIRRQAAAFRGVEHRLEIVTEIDGVRFVNDSQGTQPDAVIAALNAFEAPIVLIAGGRDKDVDLTALADVVAQRADAAVLIGESAEQLERLFGAAGLGRIDRAPTLESAVAIADAIARDRLAALGERGLATAEPATVLLSPAAASFDMFVDYAARGRAFKQAVADLAARRREGAR